MSSSSESVISVLADAIRSHKAIKLVQSDSSTETSKISEAQFVSIETKENDKKYELSAVTDYEVNGKPLTLKDVIFCWLNKDTPSSEYIQLANTEHVTSLTFAQRAKLVSFLSDSNAELKFSGKKVTFGEDATNKADASSAATGSDPELGAKRQKVDPVYEKVKSHEREVANDYRGQDDFSYLIKLSQVKVIEQLKHKPSSSSSSSRSSGRPGSSSSSSSSGHGRLSNERGKDPIIILSPAASSILNLSNVAKFLQDAEFEPATISSSSSGVVKIKKQTKFGPVSFLLIDNTDKFFNKPDYWGRVVGIFTTGQKWQFKNYQISNPSELFRTYPGFYVNYGEPMPTQVKEWGNVNHLSIDKYKRFRDKQLVEAFWGTVERYMTYKGYGSRK